LEKFLEEIKNSLIVPKYTMERLVEVICTILKNLPAVIIKPLKLKQEHYD